eukprot:SAG31_NODE_3788_length_3881_cov_1.735590_5_plen_108_part_00
MALSALLMVGLRAVKAQHHAVQPASQLAPYPPMHWHSWNTFTGEDRVNETNMREMANALLSTGMAAAGYDTVNVGKGCYFLVFWATIREIRDFYREMYGTNRESVTL